MKQINMKRMIMSILILPYIFGCNGTEPYDESGENKDPNNKWSDTIRLATYNMEVLGNNADYPWPIRKEPMKQLIEQYKFDIIGAQEAFISQLEDLQLPDSYTIIDYSVEGDDGVSRTPIIYDNRKFSVIKKGRFYLSESPEDRLGESWDAPRPRISTWAIFEQTGSKSRFLLINSHLWHRPLGVLAQKEGVKLLFSKVKELSMGHPIVLTGDFNVGQTDEIYRLILKENVVKDSYSLTNNRVNTDWGTFNGHNHSTKPTTRIDHIFIGNGAGNVQVDSWKIIIDSVDKIYPSDHFPVMTEIRFQISQ